MLTTSLYTGIPSEPIRQRINGPLVQIIIYAMEGEMAYKKSNDSQGVGYGYILNQAVRQYVVPKRNIHVTHKARQLWGQIFLNCPNQIPDIRVYSHRELICPTNDVLDVKTYKGNAKTIKIKLDIFKGKRIEFNKIFIEEHTTPISDMVKALYETLKKSPRNRLTSAEVIKVLDKMHITKMLKEEEALVKCARGRVNPSDIITKPSQVLFNDIVASTKGYPQNYIP